MDICSALDRVLDGSGADFTVLALKQQDFGSVGKEFRRATLVALDVRELMAEDAVIGLAQRGERKGIGSRAIEDEKDLAFRFKYVTDQIRRFGSPGVIAIAAHVA